MSSTLGHRTQRRLFDGEHGEEETPLRPEEAAAPRNLPAVESVLQTQAPLAAESGAPGMAPEPVPMAIRLFAGLTDFVAHLGAFALGLVGVRMLGIVPALADIPALLALLLVYSLFYTVFPLAFWGRTPGMVAAGIEARSAGGALPSFGQAARRWLACILVVASGGLLALLALTGTSLPDRLSGSRTYLV